MTTSDFPTAVCLALSAENISGHLDNQDLDLQEGHKAILKDLTQVQQRAQEVYSKIGLLQKQN